MPTDMSENVRDIVTTTTNASNNKTIAADATTVNTNISTTTRTNNTITTSIRPEKKAHTTLDNIDIKILAGDENQLGIDDHNSTK